MTWRGSLIAQRGGAAFPAQWSIASTGQDLEVGRRDGGCMLPDTSADPSAAVVRYQA
jgi:hypothetical protein